MIRKLALAAAIAAATTALLPAPAYAQQTAVWQGGITHTADAALYVDPSVPQVVYLDPQTLTPLPKPQQHLADIADTGNDDPRGIWSDGSIVYVSDWSDERLYAYSLIDGRQKPDRDIELHPGNWSPEGIAALRPEGSSDYVIYVADSAARKLYAYWLHNGSYAPAYDIDLDRKNQDPAGLWVLDGRLMVADLSARTAFAYAPDGTRHPDMDITGLNEGTYAMLGDLEGPPDRQADATAFDAPLLDPSFEIKGIKVSHLEGAAGEVVLIWGYHSGYSPSDASHVQVQWREDGKDWSPSHMATRAHRHHSTGRLSVGNIPDGLHEFRVRLIGSDPQSAPAASLVGDWSAVAKGVSDNPHKKLARKIERDVVKKHEGLHPWIAAAWDHVKNHSKVVTDWPNAPVDDDPGPKKPHSTNIGHVSYNCGLDYVGYAPKFTCLVNEFYIRSDILHTKSFEKTVIHELAHTFTLSSTQGADTRPASVAAAFMYFMDRSRSHDDCSAEELFADALVWPVLASPNSAEWNRRLSYYYRKCPHTQSRPTQQDSDAAHQAAAGNWPKWFADRYCNSDGSRCDTESIWADLVDLHQSGPHALSMMYAVLAHFSNAFGGYCNYNGISPIEHLKSPSQPGTPFSDDGC